MAAVCALWKDTDQQLRCISAADCLTKRVAAGLGIFPNPTINLPGILGELLHFSPSFYFFCVIRSVAKSSCGATHRGKICPRVLGLLVYHTMQLSTLTSWTELIGPISACLCKPPDSMNSLSVYILCTSGVSTQLKPVLLEDWAFTLDLGSRILYDSVPGLG